ncbi:methylmalonyl-CoA mutase family protein [Mesobacillus zeae]|nr:methylmalonyl-CoA mutase family protein [Mesobacillus zeae]
MLSRQDSLKMTVDNMKNATFLDLSIADWEKAAAASLKGKPLESLYTDTYENIQLKPLYTGDDAKGSEALEFHRGIAPFGYAEEGWHGANPVAYENAADLEENLVRAFSRGQTAISFEVRPGLFSDPEKLAEMLKTAGTEKPFSLRPRGLHKLMLAAVIQALNETENGKTANGFIAADPVAEVAVSGRIPSDEEAFFKDWEHTLKVAHKHLPSVRTVLADTSPYHNAGANAVQELGIAVSTGVFFAEKLLERGWDLETALSKIVFHFSSGSNFFMETAKFRAARLLWSKAAEAFGAGKDSRRMVISAETSRFTKTVYDPYVNLLRAGNEAFSAVLGGVQYLETGTLDEAAGASSPFSERIAGNTHMILREEAHLEKVADPSGGSWYIESLTRTLAEQGWNLFLEIEESGGIFEAMKSGMLQEKIAQTRAARDKDIDTRRQSIIGTNVYANAEEQPEKRRGSEPVEKYNAEGSIEDFLAMMVSRKKLEGVLKKQDGAATFTPLPQQRLAEPFESLKERSGEIKRRTEKRPAVGLLCLGEVFRHKARADFVSGFLAAGGICAVRSQGIQDAKEAVEWIKSTGLQHFCLCGNDAQYSEIGLDIARGIASVYPDAKIFLAGLPPKDERQSWSEAGIQEFINMRSSSLTLLSQLLNEMEVVIDEKA